MMRTKKPLALDAWLAWPAPERKKVLAIGETRQYHRVYYGNLGVSFNLQYKIITQYFHLPIILINDVIFAWMKGYVAMPVRSWKVIEPLGSFFTYHQLQVENNLLMNVDFSMVYFSLMDFWKLYKGPDKKRL